LIASVISGVWDKPVGCALEVAKRAVGLERIAEREEAAHLAAIADGIAAQTAATRDIETAKLLLAINSFQIRQV
jgi:hypothetical protein